VKIKSVLRLALRRLRHNWKIHLAAMLLTALTGCAFLLYQSYMSQMGARLSEQTDALQMLADIYVDLPAGSFMNGPAEVTGAWRNRPQPLPVAAGFGFTASSSYGRLPVLAISPLETYTGPQPEGDRVLVPVELVESLGLPLGEQIQLLLPNGQRIIATLHDEAYTSSAATAELLVSYSWLAEAMVQPGFNRFLYNLPANGELSGVLALLQRFYQDSTLRNRYQPAQLAQQAVKDTYSSSSSLVVLLFIFLGLGVLTALLLSFLDSKRELSVLKSLGLTPMELSGLFFGSGFFTALLGMAAAIGLGMGVVALLQSRGVLLPLATGELSAMLLWIGSAYVVATAIPAGLARRATVNQLLYDQPIPLVSTQVRGLRGRNPVYEQHINQGWQVVRLPVIDGVLEGFVFKRLGDRVKKGEVMAYAPGWWGLTYTEYVAAIDGTVGFWYPESGFLGVKPDHP
jgi:hypothetical protein